jgi:hypothetical protein
LTLSEPLSFLPTGLGSVICHIEAIILQANAAWWAWGKNEETNSKSKPIGCWLQQRMMFLSGQYKMYFGDDRTPKN